MIEIPRQNSNDFDPMWVGDQIYFLSDRNGPVTLFSYDTRSRQVRQLIEISTDGGTSWHATFDARYRKAS